MGALTDRLLRPLRLARARAGGLLVRENELPAPIVADAFDPEFRYGEAAYNAIGVAPNGIVYAVVGTKCLEAGARLIAFDPATSALRTVAELDEVLTPRGTHAIPHGKVHVDLVPMGGRMIGATHIGYYDPQADIERPGTAEGYLPYPGGCLFAIEPDESIVPLAQAPEGEGMLAMSVDADRERVHVLTWPRGLLLTCEQSAIVSHGPVFGAGETGSKRRGDWSRICRSLAIDPATGHVFWCDMTGAIHRHDGRAAARVASMPRADMWRKMLWHPEHRVFYGVGWSTGMLVRFDPRLLACEELGPFRAHPTAPSTLAFALQGDTLHTLATGPGVQTRRIRLAASVWHLTHDLETGTTRSHGPLRLSDGRWVTQAQSLAVEEDTFFGLMHVEARKGPPRPPTPESRVRGYHEEIAFVRFGG